MGEQVLGRRGRWITGVAFALIALSVATLAVVAIA